MNVDRARTLMAAFADREARYLWTDAFAVCNYVGLSRVLGDEQWLARASDLVERVHRTLGRHRGDDGRAGWLSGLDETRGAERPTRGGLRIGKKLRERREGERIDPRLEWDRDGQYFHYLTKWMHALDVMARERSDARMLRFARELAIVAHAAFTNDGRMYWKMSVDLSRPLVTSMGHHDPLDGLVTYAQIRETARALGDGEDAAALDGAIASFAAMLEDRDLTTDDLLGLGGLLIDAYRLDQLAQRDAFAGADVLRDRVLDAARDGLNVGTADDELERSAEARLAFRELGLAIGLAAVARMPEQRATFDPFQQLGARIVSFWTDPENQRSRTFLDHRDINEVMLASSLVPDGCLLLQRPPLH